MACQKKQTLFKFALSLFFFLPGLGHTQDKLDFVDIEHSQKAKFSQTQPEDITDENFPEKIGNIDFQNADILLVVKAISRLTGKNFVIDPSVSGGKITIIAPTPMTVAQLYRVFHSSLAMNNYTVVPLRGTDVLKIRRVSDAITDSIDFYY